MTATLLLAGGQWHHASDSWGPGHGFPWFPLIPLFFIGLWVTLFVLVGRRWRSPQRLGEAVLAERYARGEIDETELRERREGLRRR